MQEVDVTKRLADLQHRIEGAAFYQRLAGSDFGKEILCILRQRKDLIHEMYRAIDAAGPNARIALAEQQAREFEIDHWIRSMVDSTKYQTDLDKEYNDVVALNAKMKIEAAAERPSFISKRIVTKSEGDANGNDTRAS